MKNRMLMSILALVSAALLLVFATFAWFTVSTTVSNDDISINVLDVDASLVLEVCVTNCTSESGIWTNATSITITNAIPGDTFYYRLIVTNIGDIAISTRIQLMGFIDDLINPAGYQSTQSLMTGITLSTAIDTPVVATPLLLSEMTIDGSNPSTAIIVLATAIPLGIEESNKSSIVYFAFTVTNIGNDYRNLSLSISQIQAQLAQE